MIEESESSKLGDAPGGSPLHISRRLKRLSLGCPRHPLLHQQKSQVFFHDTTFLLLQSLCVVLGASLFLFLVLFCSICCNKLVGPQHISFGEVTP